MDVNEILKLTDELVFTKMGKHLDYLQKAILKGTLLNQTYSKIAETTYTSEGHVRDVGAELWKILSEGLGEEVSKTNLRTILEKIEFNNFSSAIISGNVTVNNVNFCEEKAPKFPENHHQPKTKPHIDLGEAPEIVSFYGRTEELTRLENWILEEHCRFVTILGINGIGKTALSIRLIEQIKTHFDYVIYRSLRFAPTLDLTLNNLLQIFSYPSKNSALKKSTSDHIDILISELIKHFRQNRCLIVLDDAQALFSSKQLAGQYKRNYENYYLFFNLIIATSHQSCLLLNSREKPREVVKVKKENNPLRCLVLASLGIAAKEILQEQQLTDETTWEKLINIYQGNPRWLEFTTTMIQEVCGSSVANFLQYDMPILAEPLQVDLDQHFQRLTPQEQAIMIQLTKESEPITLLQLMEKINLSSSESLNAMQSLGRRFLLDGIQQENGFFFTLETVIKQYVKNRYL